MKHLLLFTLMSLLSFNASLKAQSQAPSGKKILVAYFSCTGTTEKTAEAISRAVDGTLYRITPASPYTSADLDWTNKSSRSSVEMNTEDARPALAGEALDVADYDMVFLGYPIWWDLCPRPVNTFLEKYDFTGKTVIPFATSGGSSITNSVRQLKKLYPQAQWNDGRLLNSSTAKAVEWSKQIINANQ